MHHIVFHLAGRRGPTGLPENAGITAETEPARVGAVARTLRGLGQRVSIVGDATLSASADPPTTCDVLMTVPLGRLAVPARPAERITARWRILWIDREELLEGLHRGDFDYVYVTWAHLRRRVMARWGLASDRVLTTGLGASAREPEGSPRGTSRPDPHRVAFLAGREPAFDTAIRILQELHEHDRRFSIEVLVEPELDGTAVPPPSSYPGLSVRSIRDGDELAGISAMACLLVTPSAMERHADLVIEARKTGAIVIGSVGGTAEELILPEYDGVLLDEEPQSPTFAKACASRIMRLCEEQELAERLRARAIEEPLSWRAIAGQWVAHWDGLAAPSGPAPTSPPRVSVVMTVWNEASYIEEAIDSILGQTVWDLELIVVNDGSTDGTAEILHRYDDARLNVLDQENTGQWAALNRGLREACGELVARMDGDDIAHPRRLQHELEFLDAHPEVALVGTACYKVDASGRIVMLYPVPISDREIKGGLPRGSQFIHPSVIIRRRALERVGGYRCHEAEDYELWLRISERFEVANLPQPLHKLRRTGKTRVARFEKEIIESARRCAEQALLRCETGRDSESHPALRRRPILGFPLGDLTWAERTPYARTLHAWGEATLATDRTRALALLARAALLAPEIRQHWRSWLRAGWPRGG